MKRPSITDWLLALLVNVSACAPVQLKDCALEVSRSNAGDRLVCSNHGPIPLKNVDPALRQCVLGARP